MISTTIYFMIQGFEYFEIEIEDSEVKLDFYIYVVFIPIALILAFGLISIVEKYKKTTEREETD